MTRWRELPPVPIPASFGNLGLPPLIAQTLVRRGLTTSEAVQAYLNPNDRPLIPFPGLEPAIERILLAIRKEQPICVWGDFDVDGQSATALLVQTLNALNARVSYYIPVRGRESHGVHLESLKPLLDNGIRLLVTCDTGITAHEAIDYAQTRGVDVILTDHHDPGEKLPNAFAIINPKLLPAGHPLENLAGVGVAYKLAEGLLSVGQARLEPASLLDLAALGLIADVALLQGETRSLVQKGICALRATPRLGLRIMAEFANTNLETLTEETIGFVFAPRLNALGRLGDANPAVELLLTNDDVRARLLAAQIENLNAQRRLLTSQVFQAAETQLKENPGLLDEPVILLSHPNWPGGVVGIVASRLVERYHRPVILLTENEDGLLRGSARSVEGLHITEAIAACRDILLGFGGHPMAAGLSLEREKLTEFRRRLGQAIRAQLGQIVPEEPALEIDAWLRLDEITFDLAEALEKLAPFGAGNPPLVLATRNLRLKSVVPIGKTREHLRLTVEDEHGQSQSILWWGGAGEELPETGQGIDIAYSLRASAFRGERQLNLQLLDYRLVETSIIEIQPPAIEVIDWRKRAGQIPGGAQIFAEGEHRQEIGGVDRYHLTPASELVIYTAPPSVADWHTILERVAPQKLYLVAAVPSDEKAEAFLTRLGGLVKYALNQRGGKVSLQELSAACAQREDTVRLGLAWLEAGGHLTIDENEDSLQLAAGNGRAEPYLQRELYIAIKGLLAETAAYRAYFKEASAEKLLKA